MDNAAHQPARSPPTSLSLAALTIPTDLSGVGSNVSQPASPHTGPNKGTASTPSGGDGGGGGGGGGILGWVKTAFSVPLSSNRAGASSPRSLTPKQADAQPTQIKCEVPTTLPSRNFDTDFFGQRRQFTVSSPSMASSGHVSLTKDEDDYDEDDEDEDEELYASFEATSERNDSTMSSGSQPTRCVLEGPRLTESGGSKVLRPMARRSISLDHGDKEQLDADIARMSIAQREPTVSDGGSMPKRECSSLNIPQTPRHTGRPLQPDFPVHPTLQPFIIRLDP